MAISFDKFVPDANQRAGSRARKFSELLLKQGTDTSPVYGWGQGIARLLAAGVGAYNLDKADTLDKEERNKGFGEILGKDPAILSTSQNPYTQNYRLMKQMEDMEGQKIPKEIQIYEYLKGLNDGQPQPTPQPTTPPQVGTDSLVATPTGGGEPVIPLPQSSAPTKIPFPNLKLPQRGSLPIINKMEQYRTAPQGAIDAQGGEQLPMPNAIDPSSVPVPPVAGAPDLATQYMQSKLLGMKPKDVQAAGAKDMAQYSQMEKMQGVSDRITDLIEVVKNEPFTTGTVAGYTENIKGSPAYNLKAQIKPIIANLGFDELRTLKDAGGTLGQVAIVELENLQKSVANLDLATGQDQMLKELSLVKKHYDKLLDIKRKISGQVAPTPQPQSKGYDLEYDPTTGSFK